MKVVFGVNNIGLGHAIRSFAIIQYLKNLLKDNIEIIIITGEKGLAKDYFISKGIKTYVLPIDAFFVKEMKLDIKKSLLLNIFQSFRLLKILAKHKEIMKDISDADMYISDCSIHLSLMKYLDILNRKKPFISIYHHVEILENKEFLNIIKESKDLVEQVKILSLFYKIIENISDIIIIPSLSKEYEEYNKKIYVEHPIRKEIIEAKDKTYKDDYILIILSNMFIKDEEVISKLLNILKGKENLKFKLTSKVKFKTNKNIEILEPIYNDRKWAEILARSRAIITNSGTNTISECLFLNKPFITIPINNHVEQLYNAWIVKKNNLGIVSKLEKLSKDLSNLMKNITITKRIIKNHPIKGKGAYIIAKILKDIGESKKVL